MTKVDEPIEFVDPPLKAAVQRAWGGECCPDALRHRLAANLKSRPKIIRVWWAAPLSAAAIVLLVIGGWRVMYFSASHSVSTLPALLQVALVQRHDQCSKLANHQHLDDLPKTDDAGIAADMRAKLSHAVLMARPTEPGWTFRGASICPVGSTPSGHLVFVKGETALSVFSLPASSDQALHDGDHAESTSSGHPIVAFAKDGAVFCLVGSGPPGSINVNDLVKLRDQMEANVVAAGSPQPGPAITELIYLRH